MEASKSERALIKTKSSRTPEMRFLIIFAKIFVPVLAAVLGLAVMVWKQSQIPPLDPKFEGALIKSNLAVIESSKVRLLIIRGIGQTSEDMSVDARKKIYEAINSGKYNIAAVETTYSGSNLLSAAIAYYPDSIGDGNNLRVLFIDDGGWLQGWASKVKGIEARLKAQLERIEKTGDYNVVRIRPEISNGYLFGAEIYYTVARKKPASFITS